MSDDEDPIKIPLPPRKKRQGNLWVVEVESPPHPMSVQCSVCMAHRGMLCYEDCDEEDDFVTPERIRGGYHAERVRWARELHRRQEAEKKTKNRQAPDGRNDSGENDP